MNHAMTSTFSPRTNRNLSHCLAATVGIMLLTGTVLAQSGRPAPTPPASQTPDTAPQETLPREKDTSGGAGRRVMDDQLVKGGFKDVSIGEMIEWIASLTGKVIIPVRPQTLNSTKITLIIDEFITKNEALDYVFSTFRLNGIGVIETEKVIIISMLDDIRQNPDLPVLDTETNVMNRTDRGTMVIKIFKVENRNANGILELIEETAPTYATVSVDVDSNSIMVLGDIGYCQQVQRIIDELDNQWVRGKMVTYRLAHADAQEIADNIFELFESSGSAVGGRRPTQQRNRQPRQGQRPTPPTLASSGAGPEVEMKVTVNVQQNTVTVKADPSVIEQITRLINEEWDLPRPESTTKVYQLKYTDPIVVRDTLSELLGTGGGSRGGGRSTGGRPGQQTVGGGASGAAPELGNIYRIEAFPALNSLIVIGKTKDSFGFLDDMIEKIDRPTDIGLPLVIELNHADAVELSEELNALLQEAGAGVGLSIAGRGLSGPGLDSGDTGGGGGGGGATGAVGREAEGARDLQFPWQRGRQDEERTPESPLIGNIRIMPIVRQNALAILCPPSQREAVKTLIHSFDLPGRQVLISAIIAEVELTDDLALGLRVSSNALSVTNIDNALSGTITGSGQEVNVWNSLFNTSTLDVNFNVNAVIQALSQITNIRILQEPAVFTADNQEAYFFDGQDVPFVNNSNTTDQGGLTQSFEYRQVGVVLNVRPRITAQNDVNMEIYLELSSIVPGQTLFGGFIIDRRSTTTEITVKSGQTIIVSGILRDSETEITRKVPFLGDIPIIGELFKSREKQTITSELVAFITPIVVPNPAAQEIYSEENRRLLEELSRPLNEHGNRQDNVRQRMIDPPVVPKLLDDSGSSSDGRTRDLRDDTKNPRKRNRSGR